MIWPFRKRKQPPEEVQQMIEDMTTESLADIAREELLKSCPNFHKTVIACACISCPKLGKCGIEAMYANVCNPEKCDPPKWVSVCSVKRALKGECDAEERKGSCTEDGGGSPPPGRIVLLDRLPE